MIVWLAVSIGSFRTHNVTRFLFRFTDDLEDSKLYIRTSYFIYDYISVNLFKKNRQYFDDSHSSLIFAWDNIDAIYVLLRHKFNVVSWKKLKCPMEHILQINISIF